MDCSAEAMAVVDEIRHRARPLRIQTSHEAVPGAKQEARTVYYCVSRSCRVYQLALENPRRDIVMMDADLLVRRDLRGLPGFESAAKRIGLQHWPHEPIWQEFGGGIYWLKASEAATRFMGEVARFIAHNIRSGNTNWFLDQLAIWSTFRTRVDQHEVELADSAKMCDLKHGDEAVIWAVTTEKSGPNRYNAYKQYLLCKYGGVPLENG
jgi:hypothetical protein